MQKITLEEFDKLKGEFDKLKGEFDSLYEWLRGYSGLSDVDDLTFYDGTPFDLSKADSKSENGIVRFFYKKNGVNISFDMQVNELLTDDKYTHSKRKVLEEIEKRMKERVLEINEELLKYDLSDISPEKLGTMVLFVADEFKGLRGTGANIDFSIIYELGIGELHLADVRGCNLLNLDFDKTIVSDRVVDEEVIDANREYFLDRPSDENDPKHEAIDRYYDRSLTADDIILLRNELSDKTKKIKFSDTYDFLIDKIGLNRVIDILEMEPVFMRTFIEALNDEYCENITDDMTPSDIIDVWFFVASESIEKRGFNVNKLRTKENLPLRIDGIIKVDVTKYGENFIRRNPQYFLEDRDLPEEIKQKFYNNKLTIQEYQQYKEKFEGKMLGVGIDDNARIKKYIGSRKFGVLIEKNSEAIDYIIRHGSFMNIEVFVEKLRHKDGEELVDAFNKAMEDFIGKHKVALFNRDVNIMNIYHEKFIRENLPELFIDENAPEELKIAFYERKIGFAELTLHPEWISWLEGKDEYIKHCCLKSKMYDTWKSDDAQYEYGNISEEVELYMASLYEDELRRDIKKGIYVRSEILNGSFRENNPDLFFDDLPEELQKLFIERNSTMKDFFDLPAEKKELLRGKEISMMLRKYIGEADFCRRIGGSFEDFEIYEKYRGILSLAMAEIQNRRLVGKNVEELIKSAGLEAIKLSGIQYDDRVPKEFKEENAEFFLDENAPEELKMFFYRENNTLNYKFRYLKGRPEFAQYLQGKDIEHIFSKKYKDFFAFCESQDLARELGIKYGDRVSDIESSHYREVDDDLTKEEQFEKIVYAAIENREYMYDENMPEDFKEKFPELFLSQDDWEFLIQSMSFNEAYELKMTFYNQSMSFEELMRFPALVEIMKSKNVRALLPKEAGYLIELCDGNTKELLKLAVEYGDTLLSENFSNKAKANKEWFKEWVKEDVIDRLLYETITERKLAERASLPDRFKNQYPELFVMPEDIEKLGDIDESTVRIIKEKFYYGALNFEELKSNQALRDIIKTKDTNVCMLVNEGMFIDEFTKLLDGDRDKAINLASGRFATNLHNLLMNGGDERNIEKIIKFYEVAPKNKKFIPHHIVVRNFPENREKEFMLNCDLWGKLMSMSEYNVHADYIGSMLEAAIVMGVFETKEFERDGETRVQGAGEKGLEKLQLLLNKKSKYYRNPPENLKEEGKVTSVGYGYIKTTTDYKEELIYQRLQRAAISQDLSDELVQGDLQEDEYLSLIMQMSGVGIDAKKYFEPNINGTYRCNIDINMPDKIKVMYETLGIKDDSVLTEEQFELIKNCNHDYILNAFVKTESGYKFNMAKIGDKFVIGGNTDIDETQSKSNQKLFNYIKFLMLEYGLNVEGGMLAANNDRSKIELLLDEEKMQRIMNAADEISKKAQEKYTYEELWLAQDEVKPKIYTPDKLHQVFSGMKKEYNKEFSEFLLEYGAEIASDSDLLSRINAIQEMVIKISEDRELDEKKITPQLVIHMLGNPNYSNVKVGFEKGVELAQKFAFTQEQFEQAQELWEEARKREASSIPRIEKKEEEYSYEVLRLDDAVGIFIGNITDCCQKIGGPGDTAMLHSMTEKNGRVFVVRDANNKIIAQSWLWRNGNTICFDNVEVPHSAHSQDNEVMIYEALKKAAMHLCEKDSEVLDKLVEEGKIDKAKAEAMKARKITVGKGNTDIKEIAHNRDSNIEDKEVKHPLESRKSYFGKSLYVSDSSRQVILYQAYDYEEGLQVPTLAIHRDLNDEKTGEELSRADLETIKTIENEVLGEGGKEYGQVNTVVDLANLYGITPEELRMVKGTDWFMLYSENEEEIKVHKMLKSPSSGAIKKSVREQKEAVKMIMDKAAEQNKTISMEIDNDRVYEAAKIMIKHAEKHYGMTIDEEKYYRGYRIEISGIEER